MNISSEKNDLGKSLVKLPTTMVSQMGSSDAVIGHINHNEAKCFLLYTNIQHMIKIPNHSPYESA